MAKPSVTDIVGFSEVQAALDKAVDLKEVLDIRDKAEALRVYHKRIEEGGKAQNKCAEIKVRAERRAGELLRDQIPHGGGRPKPSQSTRVLKDLGITWDESSRWQRIAQFGREAFEAYLRSPGGKTGELTTAGLLRLIRSMPTDGVKTAEETEGDATGGKIETFDDPNVAGLIRCIYADPPWAYGDKGCGGGVGPQYSTMKPDEICRLPIWKLPHRDGAHLWLWTTWPMIRDGIPHQVLKAWGFRWVGEIAWVKPGLGVGRWLRPSTEILILGVCEKNLKLLRQNQRGHFETPREGHSRKPEAFRALIESLSPGPRIELFARRAAEGWYRWGKQA